MSRTPPDLLISYQLPLTEEVIQSFVDAVNAPGLTLAVEPRPPSGPFAGFQWLLPTAVLIWFGKSYFDGFLKEAGKEHYALVKRGLSSLWPLFFGENQSVRITTVGTPGKISPDDAKYSLGISILAEAGSGLQFKLLFSDDMSAGDFNAATARFLHFLEKHYAGSLDAATERRLGAARAIGRTIFVTYDSDQGFFIFLDPIPKEPGSSVLRRAGGSISHANGFTSEDREFARLAIDEARKSVPEDDKRPHPKVGAVVVKDGKVLAVAHRGELPGCHAEYIALECKLAGSSLVDATVYTTLEPCTERNHPKVPCAQRLVERKVKRVVIGTLDPNPKIRGLGQQILRDANIITDLFPHDLMSQVEELNRDFKRLHKAGIASGTDTEAPAPPSVIQTPIPLPIAEAYEVNRGLETDRRNLEDLLEVLPSGGAIQFLRTNNFAGFPFDWEQLKDLDRFRHERSGPDNEFIDPEIERLRLDLQTKCNSLTGYLTLNTWYLPTSGEGRYASVPEEWESEQPERFERVIETIHAQARHVCDAYDQLIRTARRKLSR